MYAFVWSAPYRKLHYYRSDVMLNGFVYAFLLAQGGLS